MKALVIVSNAMKRSSKINAKMDFAMQHLASNMAAMRWQRPKLTGWNQRAHCHLFKGGRVGSAGRNFKFQLGAAACCRAEWLGGGQGQRKPYHQHLVAQWQDLWYLQDYIEARNLSHHYQTWFWAWSSKAGNWTTPRQGGVRGRQRGVRGTESTHSRWIKLLLNFQSTWRELMPRKLKIISTKFQ